MRMNVWQNRRDSLTDQENRAKPGLNIELDFHSSLNSTFSSWKQNSMNHGDSQKGRENACGNKNNVNKGSGKMINCLERSKSVSFCWFFFSSDQGWQGKLCILFHFPEVCHCPTLAGEVLPHGNQSRNSSLCSRLKNCTELQDTVYKYRIQQE